MYNANTRTGRLALIAMFGLSSATALGQTATTHTAKCEPIAGCPNPNLCRYTVAGTATGVGNNYTITLQNLDNQGANIGGQEVITVTDGNGNWRRSWEAACGAVSVNVCFTDNPGFRGPGTCSEIDYSLVQCPTVSPIGFAAIAALTLSAGGVVLARRKK